MYCEEIIMKINKLIFELQKEEPTDAIKIALHELTHTKNLIIDGFTYDYYLETGEIKKLNHISQF